MSAAELVSVVLIFASFVACFCAWDAEVGGGELTSLEGKAREVWVNERIREKAGLKSPHDFTYEDVERALAVHDLRDDLFANPGDYCATLVEPSTETWYAGNVAHMKVRHPCYEVTRRDGGTMSGFHSLKVTEVPAECIEGKLPSVTYGTVPRR